MNELPFIVRRDPIETSNNTRMDWENTFPNKQREKIMKKIFEKKKEDQSLTREELDIKYENDPLYWKDSLERLERFNKIYDSYWMMRKRNTLWNTHYDDVEVPSLEETDYVIVDISHLKKDVLPHLQKLVDSQNKYFKRFSEVGSWNCLQGLLAEALYMGVRGVLGELTKDDLEYNDIVYPIGAESKIGWMRKIEECA